MPSENRTDQVRGAEDVKTPREDAGSDAVQPRAVPGYLGFVDAEVRGDRTLAALGSENGVGVLRGGGGYGGGGAGAG